MHLLISFLFIYLFVCLFFFFLNSFTVKIEYVRWLRDDIAIVDSRMPDLLPPPRITLFNNGSLQVRDVKANDTAQYLCEVMTTTKMLESQLHTIEVQCKFIVYSTQFRMSEWPND